MNELFSLSSITHETLVNFKYIQTNDYTKRLNDPGYFT